MRHIMTNSEVPHAWYHRAQSDAKTSNGNLYFSGDTIYSYGSHFPIARHVANKQGDHAVLFTTRTYGNTTARHCSRTARAIPDSAVVFHVPLYGGYQELEFPQYLNDYTARIAEKGASLSRARSSWRKEYGFSSYVKLISEANQFIKFFSLKHAPFEIPASFDSLRDTLARARELQAIADAKAQAVLIRRNKQAIKQWLGGAPVPFPSSIEQVYLRVAGDEVQTSMGARVPISHALAGLAVVRRVVARGEAYRRNGHTLHLGYYAIDAIDIDGTLHAGCHHISYSEIQRIAPVLEAYSASIPAGGR